MIQKDPIPISYVNSTLPEIIEIIKSEGENEHPFNVDYFTAVDTVERTLPTTLVEATTRRNPKLIGVMLSHERK